MAKLLVYRRGLAQLKVKLLALAANSMETRKVRLFIINEPKYKAIPLKIDRPASFVRRLN